MVLYTCPKGQYIFKQADPGSLFFIIKKGTVSIEINNKHIKIM
jgi:CRP-like cAMP-binding protein